MGVDHDAVVGAQSGRRGGEAIVRNRRRRPTTTTSAATTVSFAPVMSARRPSGAVCAPAERRVEADVDAVAAMRVVDARGSILVADAGQDARRDLDDRDLDAELRGRRRHLEPDQATADDGEMPGRLELPRQRDGMRLGAQVVHARRAERQRRDLAHHRAGRDDQRRIGEAPARSGDDFTCRAFDRGDPECRARAGRPHGPPCSLWAGDRGRRPRSRALPSSTALDSGGRS